VGEGVEGAARIDAADAGKAVKRLDYHLAPLGEGLDHLPRRLLRAGQRRDPGILRRSVDAGMAVDRELGCGADQILGPDAVSQAPNGHRIGLAPAVEEDEAVAYLRIAQEAHMLGPVIDHAAVDFIAHHRDVGEALEPFDEALDLAARHDAARWIGRTIEDDEA